MGGPRVVQGKPVINEPNPVDQGPSSSTEQRSPPKGPEKAAENGSSAFPPDFIKPTEFGREQTSWSVIDADSKHHFASGRTYHGYKEGKYFLPNDGQEQDRLDLQHHALHLLFDRRLALAPMKETPKYVIDVGTGTGIWAREFARLHPDSHVIGTDLSKIQPQTEDIPNVEFILDDSDEEWVFPTVPHFDYVHLRMMFTCFEDPKTVMRHAFNTMKPGGWIEYQDGIPGMHSDDGSIEKSTIAVFSKYGIEGLKKLGRDPWATMHYKDWLRETGFVNVVQKEFKIPMNPWPKDPKMKELGEFWLADMYDGIRGIGWKMLEAAGFSALEIETFVSDVRRDLTNLNIHGYSHIYVVYGQKPLANNATEGAVQAKQ